MNAVIGALFENMEKLQIVFEPTCEVFRKDTIQTGGGKEVTVKEFLQSFFPSSFIIKKGPIYNLEAESRENDCVILAPNHPLLLTPKRQVIIAEGVYAAVEVKPYIATLTNKSEFHRALDQIQSVKKLKRNLPAYKHTPDGLLRIPCIIFSKKSRAAIDTINYMKKCVNNGKFSAMELPDLIVTLDNGLIFHSLFIEKTLFNKWVNQQVGEKYMHLQTDLKTTLGLFILILLCFNSPEPLISDHIIKDYLKQGFTKVEYQVIDPT